MERAHDGMQLVETAVLGPSLRPVGGLLRGLDGTPADANDPGQLVIGEAQPRLEPIEGPVRT
jgi:hypothetical protein